MSALICQFQLDRLLAWRDPINRRLYRKFIRQLFLDRLLVVHQANESLYVVSTEVLKKITKVLTTNLFTQHS